MKLSSRTRKLLIGLFWIAGWQIASLLIDNTILFVGPADVVRTLIFLLPKADFWQSVASSFYKITLGTFSAFILGILLGSLAYRFALLKEFLEPVMLLMKSIPVASFVILALIWIGSKNLSVFICFTVVLPSIYVSTIAGLESTDKKLLELTGVFHTPVRKRIRMIYLPALFPYLYSSCKTALGMSWKSGIAAEVIGIPSRSIGEKLYMAKIYLSTAELFAWTIVIILVSAVFERVILEIMDLLERQLYKTTKLTK